MPFSDYRSLSAADISAVALKAGFREGSGAAIAVAIALAESGGNIRAENVNSDKWHSRDRGLWQINDHWHKEVSDSCAFSPICCAKAALRISVNGTQWSQWATYTNGAYRGHLDEARQGIRSVKAVGVDEYINRRPLLTEGGSGSNNPAEWGWGNDPIVGKVGEAKDALMSLPNFLTKISSTEFLLRAAKVISGILALLIGAVLLARSLGAPIPSIAKVASGGRAS